MTEINRRIREAGVVWSRCRNCEREWPFPKGYDPLDFQLREWICTTCCNAELARLKRAISART